MAIQNNIRLVLTVAAILFNQNANAVTLPSKGMCAWLFSGEGKKESLSKVSRLKLANEFVHLSDEEIAIRVTQAYPEIMALTGDVNASPFGITMAHPEKPLASEKLFGKQHPEFDRTIAGILVFKWILTGNYEKLTSVQKGDVKLARDRFERIREYVKRVVPDSQAMDAMITSMVINDLGKIKAFVEKTQKETGIQDVDHDNILLAALKKSPQISPSFMKLSQKYQNIILRGLEAKFNLGQFVQAENVAASLEGMKSLVSDPQSLDFYLVHTLIDIAGVAGHKTQDGSVVLNEPVARGFEIGIKALEGLARGRSTKQVYEDFIEAKGQIFGLSAHDPVERVAIRLATMLGLNTSMDARLVLGELQSLPTNTKAILVREMNLSGIDDGTATLVYYGPAIVTNIINAIEKAGGNRLSKGSLSIGLTTLARIYQKARIIQKATNKNGVFTVMAKQVAEAAADPHGLENKEFDLQKVGDGAEVKISDKPSINSEAFPHMMNLQELPGNRIGVIGIGGGSDGIQAALLSQMLAGSSKQTPFVISVRTSKTGSVGSSGRAGESRTVENHGGEIFPGVFRVLPQSTGSGRFLENLPAGEVPMFIVTDYQNGTLAQQIQAVVNHVGGVDTVVALDTGGDALYPSVQTERARATPDQDLRVLNTLSQFNNLKLLTAIVATGIDSPPDAQFTLQRAGAQYYEPSKNQERYVLGKYRTWQMDGTNPNRYGKTSLAWQYALRDQTGIVSLPIPTEVVLDRNNPWDPFVTIQESMKGIFFMDLKAQLRAISFSAKSQTISKELIKTELDRIHRTPRSLMEDVLDKNLWQPLNLEGDKRTVENYKPLIGKALAGVVHDTKLGVQGFFAGEFTEVVESKGRYYLRVVGPDGGLVALDSISRMHELKPQE